MAGRRSYFTEETREFLVKTDIFSGVGQSLGDGHGVKPFEVPEQMSLIGVAVTEDGVLDVKSRLQGVAPEELVADEAGQRFGRQTDAALKKPLQLPGADMQAPAQLIDRPPAAEHFPGRLQYSFAGPVRLQRRQ